MTAVLETNETEAAPKPFTVTVSVRRFDPEVDSNPFWQDFQVDVFPTDRILDALHKIKWEQDGLSLIHI